MNRRRVVGIVAAMAGAGAAGWAGYNWYQGQHTAAPTAAATAPATTLDEAQVAGSVETVDVSGDPTNPEAGTTPMKDRVAVLGLLNKRNGQARDVTLKPGQAMRIGNVVVRLRACEETAPWEQEHYTGAFVQLDIGQPDGTWKRVHSGWLYKERPSLNVVIDPIYDVWVKSCTMSFPAAGPDTVTAPSESGGSRSSAPKSPGAAPADAPPSEPSIAAPSNAT
ncbi:MAG: hypothetical protein JWM94_1365 [Sphingomonas bacterium]|nr:hypothetical protein [Sphingomonas bacterium]